MEKNKKPLWVSLALSSIESRRGALILLWGSIVFSIYCIPWSTFIATEQWVAKFFLLDDWNWFAMMIPFPLWYWLSVRWVDKNTGWS